MAALDHPSIVHIPDYGSTADGKFFHLRHCAQLSPPGALEIISRAADEGGRSVDQMTVGR